MVFVFGMDFPVMEVLVLFDLILFVYSMMLFLQLSKLQVLISKMSLIVETSVKSDIVLWSLDKLEKGMKEGDLKVTLLNTGHQNADEIILKAKSFSSKKQSNSK